MPSFHCLKGNKHINLNNFHKKLLYLIDFIPHHLLINIYLLIRPFYPCQDILKSTKLFRQFNVTFLNAFRTILLKIYTHITIKCIFPVKISI